MNLWICRSIWWNFISVLIPLSLPVWYIVYTVNKLSIFPSPAGMSLTKLSLGGNNDVIYKLFRPRESLVSDIPAGDGNIEKFFFYGVQYHSTIGCWEVRTTYFCKINILFAIFSTLYRCGYSQGFVYPWCFVGEAGYDQWRPCDSKRAQLGDR